MSILSGFRKQKRYTTDDKGRHQLISTWTHTDTVYDDEGKSLTEIIEELPAADTKVKQTASDSSNANYEVLLSASADNVTKDDEARKTQSFKYNPDSQTLTVSDVELPLATSATRIEPDLIRLGFGDLAPKMNISPSDISLTGTTWDGTNTSLKTALANAGAKVLYGTSAPTSSQGEDGQLYVQLRPTEPYLDGFVVDYSDSNEIDTGLDIRNFGECNVNIKKYEMVSDVETLTYEYNNTLDFATDVGEMYYIEDDEDHTICELTRDDRHAEPPNPQNLLVAKGYPDDYKLIITISDAETEADAIDTIYIKDNGVWLAEEDGGKVPSPTAYNVGKFLKATATGEYGWETIPKDALFFGITFAFGEVSLPTGLGVTLAGVNVPVFLYNKTVTASDYGKIYYPVAIDGVINLGCREDALWECISVETVNNEEVAYIEKIAYHMNSSDHSDETVTYTKEELSTSGGGGVAVPPVIYDNGELKKMEISGFPGIEKVYLTPTAYSNLTTAQKEDLSKIYYVSDYEFHVDPDHLEVVVRVGSNNEVKWFFSGYTFANHNRYEVPESLQQYQPNNGHGSVRVDSTPYASASSTEPINQNYFVGWSNYDQNNKIRYSSITGSVSILDGTVYAVIDIAGGSGQTNAYSDPYDVPGGFTIYYGNKQYTNFDIPDPLPTVTTSDEGKVLQVNASGEWDKGTVPRTNAVQVPPVIYDNGGLKKMAIDGFPGIERVVLTQSAYNLLTDAEKKDLSKIYYISSYEFHESNDGTVIIRFNQAGTEKLIFFNGFVDTWTGTSGNPSYYNFPAELRTIVDNNTTWSSSITVLSGNYTVDGTARTGNETYLGFKSKQYWHVCSCQNESTGAAAKNKANYAILDMLDNTKYQDNGWSDPYDVPGGYDAIFYGGKQYTDFDIPDPLPAVTGSDNGKILKVVSGEWAKGIVYREITQADYDLLPASKNSDGIIYFITDNS